MNQLNKRKANIKAKQTNSKRIIFKWKRQTRQIKLEQQKGKKQKQKQDKSV